MFMTAKCMKSNASRVLVALHGGAATTATATSTGRNIAPTPRIAVSLEYP